MLGGAHFRVSPVGAAQLLDAAMRQSNVRQTELLRACVQRACAHVCVCAHGIMSARVQACVHACCKFPIPCLRAHAKHTWGALHVCTQAHYAGVFPNANHGLALGQPPLSNDLFIVGKCRQAVAVAVARSIARSAWSTFSMLDACMLIACVCAPCMHTFAACVRAHTHVCPHMCTHKNSHACMHAGWLAALHDACCATCVCTCTRTRVRVSVCGVGDFIVVDGKGSAIRFDERITLKVHPLKAIIQHRWYK